MLDMKKMFKSLLLIICSIPCIAEAQHNNEDATKYVYDKIYKEHIPLDGDKVMYIPFRQDSLYGFVDKRDREFVIKPRFNQVFAVYPEGAIVQYKRGYGLTSYKDSFIIPPIFKNLFKEGDIYHGVYLAKDKMKDSTLSDYYVVNHYFDERGKLLFNNKAHEQESFRGLDSMAWFRFGDIYTIYSRKGKLLKTFNREDNNRFVGIFNNTLVFDKKELENKHPHLLTGFDIAGKEKFRIRPKFYVHANGIIKMSDSMYCLMDASGETLLFFNQDGDDYPFNVNNGAIGFGFDNLFGYFSQLKLIPVTDRKTGKKGMVSTNGSILLPCKYEYIGNVENDEFAYCDSVLQGIGFMNTLGEVVIPPSLPFDNAQRSDFADNKFMYRDGLCLGHIIKRYYTTEEAMNAPNDDDNRGLNYWYTYYNRRGKEVIRLPDSIILAHHFSGRLAAVVDKKTKGLGFIDKQGKLVIPYKYEIAVIGAYPFPQVVMPEFINGFAYLKAFKGYIDDNGNEYFSGKRVKDHYNFSH